MGNVMGSCVSKGSRASTSSKQRGSRSGPVSKVESDAFANGNDNGVANEDEDGSSIGSDILHISERNDQKGVDRDKQVLFAQKNLGKKSAFEREGEERPVKYNSCSTLFVDSTVSQPDLDETMRCVAIALLISVEEGREVEAEEQNLDNIFDERLHPLTDAAVRIVMPKERDIYKFIKSFFHAASLTAECGIITLAYIERLQALTNLTMHPSNWKRVVLGAILLASKVWDDQAVWNVDFCTILPDIPVPDMNQLEKAFLEKLQFNVSVDPGLYAEYYFNLRTLAEKRNNPFTLKTLSLEGARKLEALALPESMTPTTGGMKRCKSADPFEPTPPPAIIS